MRKDLRLLENYQRCTANWNQTGFLKGEDYPVAMAYVPWQQWQMPYGPERGLAQGTIFSELDLAFDKGRCS